MSSSVSHCEFGALQTRNIDAAWHAPHALIHWTSHMARLADFGPNHGIARHRHRKASASHGTAWHRTARQCAVIE
jgi:hypothetical protein